MQQQEIVIENELTVRCPKCMKNSKADSKIGYLVKTPSCSIDYRLVVCTNLKCNYIEYIKL